MSNPPYKKRQYYNKNKKMNEKKTRKIVKDELKKEIEVKFFDRVATGNVDSVSVVAVQPLQGIARGTGPNNFLGSSIKLKSVEIRGQFIVSDAPGNLMRMLIIQDGTTTGVPTLGTMFANSTYPVYSPLNKDYTDTYRVIKDKLFLLTNDGVVSTNFLPKSFNYYLKGNRLRKTTFTNSAAAYDSGQIWIVLVSDSAVVTNPTFIMSMRCEYSDA